MWYFASFTLQSGPVAVAVCERLNALFKSVYFLSQNKPNSTNLRPYFLQSQQLRIITSMVCKLCTLQCVLCLCDVAGVIALLKENEPEVKVCLC